MTWTLNRRLRQCRRDLVPLVGFLAAHKRFQLIAHQTLLCNIGCEGLLNCLERSTQMSQLVSSPSLTMAVKSPDAIRTAPAARARPIRGDRGIVGFAGYLVDLVDINDRWIQR